eukprot:SAG31_NODE_521_length_14624_cov_34.536867_9_plen_89_part_00
MPRRLTCNYRGTATWYRYRCHRSRGLSTSMTAGRPPNPRAIPRRGRRLLNLVTTRDAPAAEYGCTVALNLVCVGLEYVPLPKLNLNNR